MLSVRIQHSDPYTTTGLIRVLYNFIFVFLDISLLWSIFWFSKEARFPAAILSFISSSIRLSLVTIVPSYLVLFTSSISLKSHFLLFTTVFLPGSNFQMYYFIRLPNKKRA
jgi:hypothetical protein